MKLIHCDLCNDVINLLYYPRYCQCGNIGGAYRRSDGRTAEIYLKDKNSFKTSRVLGFPNSVRYGKVEEGNCWSFRWSNQYLVVFVNRVLQKIIDAEPYIEKREEELIFKSEAMNSLKEFGK